MNTGLTAAEYSELVALSVVIIDNLDPREYDVKAARQRQLELFKRAAKPYSIWQDAEEIDPNSE